MKTTALAIITAVIRCIEAATALSRVRPQRCA
jgi:hypothetical protein